MFESKTVETIQADLLENVSDDYEKSTGYIMYDALKSFAIEEATIYQALDLILNLFDVDNMTGSDLSKFVLQRKGISRKLATYGTTTLNVVGTCTINTNDLFSTKTNIQFKSLETKAISGTGTINVQAVVAGSSGNVQQNTITQIPVTIQGLTSVTNANAVTNSYDEESDNDLRDRYYEALQKPVTSANKYFYVKTAKEISGVGDAICFSTWAGDNSVKVVIINSDKQPASTELVDSVQIKIDPKGTYDSVTNTWSTWGKGVGEASIGAYCTIESATGKTINVKVKITKVSTYTDDEVIANIKANLTTYFKEIALNKDINYISFAKIGNFILESDGVSDYDNSTLLVNDAQSNIVLSLTSTLAEVPVVGDVTLL